MRAPWFLLGWLGCGGDGDPTDDGPVDGDADTDSDADADSDTDTDADGPALTERPANPTCFAPARPTVAGEVTAERIFPNLSFAEVTQVLQPPDDPDTWWAVLQEGRVVRFADRADVATTEEVVDLRDRVDATGNEMGLLSVAFHPDWATNRELIVSYTAGSPMRSVISRFRSTDGGRTIDAASEEVVLTQEQPYQNHNGGLVGFGPDGFLYLGFGDGGSGGDPHGFGQNTDVLLGKMLRIDVDHGAPYTIPADNPFAAGGGRPEIYAWGLRNPWRWSFDPANGDLWVGDVGQNLVEEIDIVRRGGNYGWNIMEGDTCYEAATCDRAGLTLPVATMTHDEGHHSVTGGLVYHGRDLPSLAGRYVWADYRSGVFFALSSDPVSGALVRTRLFDSGTNPTHLGADADGELVFVDRNNGLFRLRPVGTTAPSTFPETLAATGCFGPDGAPLPMLVPYEVAHPFWSDGAEKSRFLAVPDGAVATVDEAGELVLPIGSVLVKEFRAGPRRLETRLLVRHDDGNWAGYPYVWDAAGETATLATGAVQLDVPWGSWRIPSSTECLQCHNLSTGGTLGMRLDQLDVEATQPNGWVENQVDQLVRLGLLTAPASRPGPLTALDDEAVSVERRARTWLDVNCSFCHVAGGTGGGSLDLSLDTPLAASGLCEAPVEGDLGLTDPRIVVPGDPARSVLSSRIGRRDVHQMPPLGSSVVDAAGKGVVDAWISSLSSCP